MKKKITAIALAACILVVGIVGATMSYFTDTDTKTNTFTFGKGVEITLTEDGTATEGTDGETEITLIPAKEEDVSSTGLTYDKVVPGAYYAKKPIVTLAEDCAKSYIVVKAVCSESYPVRIGGVPEGVTHKEIGNTHYFLFTSPYEGVTGENPTTVSPFEWVQVDPSLNNADTNENDTFNVEVTAYAILAAGFNSCEEAFKTAVEPIPDAVAADANALSEALASEANTVALTKDVSLRESLTAETANVVIDGVMNTITGNANAEANGGFAALVVENGASVKNLKINTADQVGSPSAGISGIEAKAGDVTIDNCTVTYGRAVYAVNAGKDLTVTNSTLNGTYALNTNAALKKITVKNTKLNGWVSWNPTTEENSFVNCEFGKGTTGYAFFKPYSNVTLEGCTFSEDFLTPGEKTGIAAGRTGFTVYLNNCKVVEGGVSTDLTVDLLKQMFNASEETGGTAEQYKSCTWKVNGVVVSFAEN